MKAAKVRRWRARPEGPKALAAALADSGLTAAVGAWSRDPLDFAQRLRRALVGLGPVHRAFGHHLAGRGDLLPPAARRELAELPPPGEPLSPTAVEERVAECLGGPAREAFAGLDPVAESCGAFRQGHRARTAGGEEVVVVLARPARVAEAEPARFAPLRSILEAAELPGRSVLAGFYRDALRDVDLEAEAELLNALAPRPREPVAPVVPAVAPELCRRGLLVHGAVGGRGVADLVGLEPPARSEALRRLVLAWLYQVVFGGAFPLRPDGPRTRFLADGRIAFAGPFETLPAASQANLWRYLEGGVVSDPSSACDRLLPELVRSPDAVSEAELLLRLRQVVAFREGGEGAGADPFAEHLLATLRVARQAGYRLRRPTAAVVEGLTRLTDLAGELASGTQPVRGAIDELRLQRTAGDLRDVLDFSRWGDLSAPHAALLLELPRKLDTALDLLTRGEARVRLELDAPTQRRGGAGGAALAGGAVAAALVLAAPRLADLLEGGTAGSVAVALLAAILVASLLWRR